MRSSIRVSSRRRLLALASAGALVLSSGFVVASTASPALAQAGCTVTFDANQWGDGNGGFTANITISASGVNGWQLGFTLPGSAQVNQGWSANWSQSGQSVTATDMGWNANLGQTTIGFNGTGFAGNPTSFTLNGTACNGGTPPPPPPPPVVPPPPPPVVPPPPPPVVPPPPPPPGQPSPRVANPYVGADVYVNPDWSAAAQAGGAPASVYNQPTGVWLDTIGSIEEGSGGDNFTSLADHLSQAAQLDQANGSTPTVIQVVIYNLPGRDCAALASNGELGPTEIGRYQTEYIDVIAGIMADSEYSNLRIVTIIEIDSIPNMVTNVSGRDGATPECDVMLANRNYYNGVGYALATLGAIPNVYNYVDAAHHGWIGWSDNFATTAQHLFDAATTNGATVGDVHGFITNTANYSALQEPFIPINSQTQQSDWIDFNQYNDELTFAQAFRNQLVTAGFSSNIGMLIDTSRNGWGGPNRPTGPSNASDTNQFVEESRIDRRIHKGNWCNQAGAGLGERPQAAPASGIHAYVWIKPPGESDGSSTLVPVGPDNPDGKGFDRMCDPTFLEGTPRNGNSPSGALANAPVSGNWFQSQFNELMANAWPPL